MYQITQLEPNYIIPIIQKEEKPPSVVKQIEEPKPEIENLAVEEPQSETIIMSPYKQDKEKEA
jgi:hypothetical protein